MRIRGEGGACPMCKKPHLSTMLNKHFLRQVNELCVFCHHKDRGCEWQGELSDLEHHVQSCPMKTAPLIFRCQVCMYVYATREVGYIVIMLRLYKGGAQVHGV